MFHVCTRLGTNAGLLYRHHARKSDQTSDDDECGRCECGSLYGSRVFPVHFSCPQSYESHCPSVLRRRKIYFGPGPKIKIKTTLTLRMERNNVFLRIGEVEGISRESISYLSLPFNVLGLSSHGYTRCIVNCNRIRDSRSDLPPCTCTFVTGRRLGLVVLHSRVTRVRGEAVTFSRRKYRSRAGKYELYTE